MILSEIRIVGSAAELGHDVLGWGYILFLCAFLRFGF